MTRYFTGDEIADIRNAWGCGVSLGILAKRYGLTEQSLRQQIGEPAWRPEPTTDRQRSLFDQIGGES